MATGSTSKFRHIFEKDEDNIIQFLLRGYDRTMKRKDKMEIVLSLQSELYAKYGVRHEIPAIPKKWCDIKFLHPDLVEENEPRARGGCELKTPDSDTSDEYEDCEDDEGWQTCSEDAEEERVIPEHDSERTEQKVVRNESHLVQGDELLEIFKSIHTGNRIREEQITVGLVGYPNVGKSSTINTILGNKKVSVSAIPGHTKHFQTLFVEPGLCLCDCPGLVMPSFVSTKAEMICSGILPIDQMRDHVPPISLIAQRIPRYVVESIYGINIIRPREDEDQDRAPTSEELLAAYGYMRGFMTAHGQPDQPRSARYILKDYVNGKLLYCHPPPGIDPSDFQPRNSLHRETNVLDCMASKNIARELFFMFSRTEIPKEILTDQGTPFMSKVMKQLCKLFKITQIRTSVYHPQTDGSDPTLTLKPADKGGAVVVMDTSKYIQVIMRQLGDQEVYKVLDSDPKFEIAEIIRKCLTDAMVADYLHNIETEGMENKVKLDAAHLSGMRHI
ncbi:large subunit GTPase 1 homolog [Bufo bufo]|uniref:large subunit GTPase 1 homolog n=1 Tax=Bufo bufo TaxID=8384 RepID=UPI001ABDBC38|nr:large subunit GTPase 1 homolog [Bufo bufo]